MRPTNFGFSLFLGWNYVFFFSGLFGDGYSDFAAATSLIGITSGLVNAITFLLIFLFAPLLGPLHMHQRIGALFSLCVFAGTLIVFAGPLLDVASLSLLVIGGTLTGIGTAWVVTCWGEYISTLNTTQITICVLGSHALGAILYFFIVALPLGASALASAVLLPLSFMLVKHSFTSAEPIPTSTPTSSKRFRAQTWRAILAFFLFGSLFWILVQTSSGSDRLSCSAQFGPSVLFSALLIALFCAGAVLLRRMISASTLYRVAPPLAVIGFSFVFLADASHNEIGFAFAMGAITCLDACLMIVLCSASHTTGYSSTRAICIGRCVEGICGPLGIALGDAGFPGVSQENVAALIAVVCTLSLIATAISKDQVHETAREGSHSLESPLSAETASPVPSAQTFAWQCDKAIADYGLSDREGEILLLITRGRSVPYIADHLHIATSTAKTHITSIYKKMAVAGRQDMIDLIETLPVDSPASDQIG